MRISEIPSPSISSNPETLIPVSLPAPSPESNTSAVAKLFVPVTPTPPNITYAAPESVPFASANFAPTNTSAAPSPLISPSDETQRPAASSVFSPVNVASVVPEPSTIMTRPELLFACSEPITMSRVPSPLKSPAPDKERPIWSPAVLPTIVASAVLLPPLCETSN